MSTFPNADVFIKDDGSVVINRKSIRVPGIELKQEISRGQEWGRDSEGSIRI